jgi:hypothetical protein
MHIEHANAQVTAAWMLSIGALAYTAGMSSAAGWSVFAALALTPAIFMMLRARRGPVPSMSESIQEVLHPGFTREARR